MSSRQIDNSHKEVKLEMRRESVKDGDTILDCCHGEGFLWGEIGQGKDISVIGIEHEKGRGRGAIHGEAEKVIPGLDLSRYQMIDVDTYGSPYQIIKCIFKNKTLAPGTVIFYTFIQTHMGLVSQESLRAIGLSKEMTKKISTLFAKLGWPAFLEYLRKQGIKKVDAWYVKERTSKKHYGRFTVALSR